MSGQDVEARPRAGRRWLFVVLIALVAIAVAVGAIRALGSDGTPTDLERARDEAADAGNFATAEDAANTLLTVGALLRREAESCVTDGEEPDRTCRAFFAGSAHAQAGSIGLLRCTRPDLFDAQAAMRSYFDDLADDAATANLPDLPYCR